MQTMHFTNSLAIAILKFKEKIENEAEIENI